MERVLRSEKGLTLVELLIALALIGLVFALAFSLYAYGVGSFEQGTAQAAYQQKARLVHTLFKKELRNAGALTLAPGGWKASMTAPFTWKTAPFITTTPRWPQRSPISRSRSSGKRADRY